MSCLTYRALFNLLFSNEFTHKINPFRFGPSISNCAVHQSLRIVLILGNSTDPDEMARSVVFYLDLNMFSKYPFRGIKRFKSTPVPFEGQIFYMLYCIVFIG